MDSNCKWKSTEEVLKNYVNDEKKTYMLLNDFDDHFADITCDWRNQFANVSK